MIITYSKRSTLRLRVPIALHKQVLEVPPIRAVRQRALPLSRPSTFPRRLTNLRATAWRTLSAADSHLRQATTQALLALFSTLRVASLVRKARAVLILAVTDKLGRTAASLGVTRVSCYVLYFLSIRTKYVSILAIKLSFIMSEWYELNNHDGQACSFAGNGTVNPLAPSTVSAANAAASSCVPNAGATFVPTALSTTSRTSSSGTSTSSSGSHGGKNSAVHLIANGQVLVGMAAVALVSIASVVWTLA